MQNTAQLDPRAQKWGNVAKYVFLVFGLAVFGPVIWLAVGGLLGLILLVSIWVGAWMLQPVVFTAAANMRLKLLKNEVAKNPVETLQNEHRKQSRILDERKEAIETMGGALKTLKQTIDMLIAEFPDSPEIPQLQADYQELLSLKKSRMEDWHFAYIALGDFEREIKRVSRLWDVSQAAAKARKQSGLTESEWESKLKTDTALDAIRTNLNTQLSALSVERMQADADRVMKRKQLPKSVNAQVLELEQNKIKQTTTS